MNSDKENIEDDDVVIGKKRVKKEIIIENMDVKEKKRKKNILI